MLRDKSKNQCCSKCLKNSESKNFFENWWRPAEKTEIFSKHPVLFCSIIFIKFLSQFFWSSGQGSELQILWSWVQTPRGKTWIYFFFIFCVFWTKIGIFCTLMHKERHKWNLFYFLKIYNNCSFSFSSKMKFSISQLDVIEMKNWDYVLNGHEKTIIELPLNVLEHFFKALNL